MARHLAWGGARAAALAAVLAAAFFRSVPLLDNRFHPDEALYGFFSLLIASGRDPLLAGVVVDKPPLSFYLGALGALLFGGGELGARLPAFYAGVISVALTFGLARRLYRASVGAAAAWALALSPLAILSPSRFFRIRCSAPSACGACG